MSRVLHSSRVLIVIAFAMLALAGPPTVAAQQSTGTVRIVKYDCTYLDEVTLVEAFDTTECAPGAGTFTFYLIGDSTADYEQVTIGADGIASIDLPVGSYEMIDEGSQTTWTITVVGGEVTNLAIGGPLAVQPQPETGTVRIVTYACSYLEEATLVEAFDETQCTPDTATFTLYLIGDGTDDVVQLVTGADGIGTIDLPVGTYEMLEEGTQARFNLTVLPGETTGLTIGNPRDAIQPTTSAPAPAPARTVTAVTVLPTTGSGSAGGSAHALTLASAAALAAAGAFNLQRKR